MTINVPSLLELLDAETTLSDLERYFDEEAVWTERFSGRRFESLGGGGDRRDTANRITADDLVAVSLLSVKIPPETAIELIEGRVGREVSALLAEIPTSVALADAADYLVATGSPADEAWKVLTACPGVGWVTAAKVLARKRPLLLPVYDHVVRCVLQQPEGFWSALRDALRADGRALERRLTELRSAAAVPPHVSTLRVLDVVLWMGHRDEHRLTCLAGR